MSDRASPAREPARRVVLAAIASLVVVAVAALVVTTLSTRSGTVIEVDVPPGTGVRMDAGAQVELLPATLRVRVGDALVVTNADDRVHEVGPYTVAPGQVLRQEFTSEGTIEGVCTLHPDGAIRIVVS